MLTVLWCLFGVVCIIVLFVVWAGLAICICHLLGMVAARYGFIVSAVVSAMSFLASSFGLFGLFHIRLPIRPRASRIINKPLQTERVVGCLGEKKKALRVLISPLTVDMRDTGLGKAIRKDEITIEEGFVTDYSSIPTILSWVMRWSKVDLAGVVHDWLYRDGQIVFADKCNCGSKYDRGQADEIWRIMAFSGEYRVTRLQARLGWLFLRCFARHTWVHPRKFIVPSDDQKVTCLDQRRDM